MTSDITCDINCKLINLPTNVHELVTPNADGSYTILLNARLSYESQQQALQHALKHIEHDDFYSETDVQTIEAKAHKE